MNTNWISAAGVMAILALAGSAGACPPDEGGSGDRDVKIYRGAAPVSRAAPRATPGGPMVAGDKLMAEQHIYLGEPERSRAAAIAIAPEGQSSDTSVFVFRNGDKDVRVTLRSGKVESATENGQEIPKSRVSIGGDKVVVIGENGEIIAEFNAPEVAAGDKVFMRAVPAAPGARPATPFYSLRAAPPAPGTKVIEPEVAQPAPKSMIGITLAPGDEILSGHLGIKADEVTMISGTSEGLAADTAGLKPYDIIVEVNGKKPADPKTVREAVRMLEPGATVTLRVIHKGSEREVRVTTEPFDAKKLETAKANMIPDVRRELASKERYLIAPTGITMAPGGREPDFMNEQEIQKLHESARQLDKELPLWQEEYARRFADAAKNKARAEEFERAAKAWADANRDARGQIWVQPAPRADEDDRLRRLEQVIERMERKMDELNKKLAETKKER